jgi:hypothetical protein
MYDRRDIRRLYGTIRYADTDLKKTVPSARAGFELGRAF